MGKSTKSAWVVLESRYEDGVLFFRVDIDDPYTDRGVFIREMWVEYWRNEVDQEYGYTGMECVFGVN